MAKQHDDVTELRAIAAAAEALSKDARAFEELFEAFRARDAARFEAVLDRVGLAHECHRICFLFCEKRCIGVCARLCPDRHATVDAKEIREFVQALSKALTNADLITRLSDAIDKDDVESWRAALKAAELERFCHQVCHFLCRVRCKRICLELCQKPEITRISAIPTSQFGPNGFGQGPSVPPFQVPPPNPAAGAADHPVGASSWLMGRFNMPTATQYLVEVANNPAGPYTPIAVPVQGYDEFVNPVTQFPVAGGWYNLAEIPFSNGGPLAAGEKTLLDWPTSMPDDLYYLRLRARDGVTEKLSGPRPVRTDNTAPPTPIITLELKTPNGDLKPLKCGQVKKGDGLIRITVQAFDPNFSRLSVAAQGNSSLSVPIVAVPEGSMGPAVPLSKTVQRQHTRYRVSDADVVHLGSLERSEYRPLLLRRTDRHLGSHRHQQRLVRRVGQLRLGGYRDRILTVPHWRGTSV